MSAEIPGQVSDREIVEAIEAVIAERDELLRRLAAAGQRAKDAEAREAALRKCVELYADDRHWAYAHTSMNLDLWLPTTHGYEPAQAALAEIAAMGARE